MTDAEIDGELQRGGIDPAPAVERVLLFVRSNVAGWRDRGLLHRCRAALMTLVQQLTAWSASPPPCRLQQT